MFAIAPATAGVGGKVFLISCRARCPAASISPPALKANNDAAAWHDWSKQLSSSTWFHRVLLHFFLPVHVRIGSLAGIGQPIRDVALPPKANMLIVGINVC